MSLRLGSLTPAALRVGASEVTAAYLGPNLVYTSAVGPEFWQPSQLAGLAHWYDADDASTITLNGSGVSQWNDKSGNNRNASQPTAAEQPTYTVAGLNGRNVLTATTPRRLLFANQTYTDGTTFIVCNDTKNSGFQVAFLITDGTKTFSLLSNLANDDWGSYLDAPRIANGNIGSDYALASIESGPTDLTFFLNGVADGVQSSIATRSVFASSGIFNDEFNSYHQGNIAEIVFYETLLSVSDRQNMEGYLAWKWGSV